MKAGLKVLFGNKTDWKQGIRATIDPVFLPSFEYFSQSDFRDYDLIAPLVIRDYTALWSRQEEVGGRVLFPSKEAVANCDDKKTFNELVAEQLPHDVIPKMYGSRDRLDLPLIAKKRQAEWGVGSKVIVDLSEAEAARRDESLILQKAIVGDREHATHLLVQDFEIIYHLDVVFQMAGDCLVKGRDALGMEIRISSECEHLDLFRNLLKVVGFANGTCCIDYKVCGSSVHIFEMNPRFGASLWLDLNGYLKALCGGLGISLA